MNQYCYSIKTAGPIDSDLVKNHINKLYSKKKFGDLAFGTDEKIPFIIIFSEKDKQVCIKMTSRAKKNVERIEGIHSKITARDLKVGDSIDLEKPFLFTLEQCAWWDSGCKVKGGEKWQTLSHNGPYFVHLLEPYEPHGTKIIYDGKKYALEPKEERVANFYARRLISEASGNVAQIWTTDKKFNENFWNGFKTYLTPAHKKIFKDFSKFDFSPIVKTLEAMKEAEKKMSTGEKQAKKIRAAEKKQNYGFATINGTVEPLGNYTIEPAAIFYGRGDNPKRGLVKRDIEPEEVTINIGEAAKIPKPPKGHKWKEVINDKNLAWIASWKDPISNENKYVYFAAEGQLKGKSDLHKYEKARKLNHYIEKVRAKYTKDLSSRTNVKKQLATVLYLIDRYGIRVGGEKDETATDTVGASTLRVEHISLKAPDTVIFDFLGKDSIRFYKELKVDPVVFKNVESFIKGKKPNAQLFDLITASDINAYLKTFDKDFSAKVFRTRLASTIMEDALNKIKIKKDMSQDEKKKMFVKANVKVADILNHQRSVSEKSKETIKKYEGELKQLQKDLREAKKDKKPARTITSLENKVQKKKDQIEGKKDTQSVAINTSLTNYIDPRLVVGWTKKNDMNIPKAYTATLQRKFKWAIDLTDEDWGYSSTPLLSEMSKLEPSTTEVKAKSSKASSGKGKGKGKRKVTKKVLVKKPKKDIFKDDDAFEDISVEEDSPVNNIRIVDYSERSIAVIGDTKSIKDKLMDLGGKFNPNLTVGGKKTAGWIFTKKQGPAVMQSLFGGSEQTSMTIDDIYKQYNLSPKEKMAITGISNVRNPGVIIKKVNISNEIINEYLACIRDVGKTLDLDDNTEPINVVMFMIYVLHNSKDRYGIIDTILANLDLDGLCPGYEGYSLVSAEPLKSLPKERLYITRNGGCIDIEDLAMHFKMSPNKVNDPTNSSARLWESDQEFQAIMNVLMESDISEMFDNLEKDIANISQQTKDSFIKFYSDVETGCDADMVCFEIADLMSTIDSFEKQAVENATAFVGMDKQMWENIYTGEDCKKSLLHTLKKVADLFTGTYLSA